MSAKLKQATKLKQEALRDMKIAATLGATGDTNCAVDFHIAATFSDAAAQQAFEIDFLPSIMAGEVVPNESERADEKGGWAIRDTLACPNVAAIQASIERTDLLTQGNIDVLALGIDAAQSANCDNSLEKMLAHQLALTHQTSFKVLDQAMRQRDSVEMARLLNASARMMTVFQQGMLTLNRIKNGGNQTVTVQHVTVNGGQTLVTGNMQAGGQSTLTGGKK
ncbi:hypothetical protein [Herminiimonas sp. CN]|uniref:hypothetical protein n=1 Tax=Herminiimonas sp. CN TaxID=1349818 RepID=UPI0004737436|nr:hypothetical protein [Herminiimonas sp. CN]